MSKFKNLKQGDVLSESAFYKVEKVSGDKVQLQMDNGESVVLNQGYVDSFLTSADQFSKTEKITRTEMAELIMSHPRLVMTVNYNKQVKAVDVIAEIEEMYQNSTPKEITTKLKKSVNKALTGEERLIVGRHYGTKDSGGRLQFIDMNEAKDLTKDYDTRQRLVDMRTLNWAIINDVKYTVK